MPDSLVQVPTAVVSVVAFVVYEVASVAASGAVSGADIPEAPERALAATSQTTCTPTTPVPTRLLVVACTGTVAVVMVAVADTVPRTTPSLASRSWFAT